jgi:hypothetical protein
MMPATKRQLILGWVALSICIAIALLWAFWGTIEAFHEGWWQPTLGGRLLYALMYLTPLAAVLLVTLMAIRLPKLGALLFFLGGGWFSWFIFSNRWPAIDFAVLLSWLPVTLLVVGVGVVWWFGRPEPRRLANLLTIGIPLLLVLVLAVEPLWRVSHRIDDGERGARLVEGNGVALVWAPAGPGWIIDASHAASWDEAMDICAHLGPDGQTLSSAPLHIWRLPTVEEAVRSMARHGVNCGGVWDAERGVATYETKPDKETPLWIPYSETIYWWTATETGTEHAWRIVYSGAVYRMRKTLRMGSQGFRAVREPTEAELAGPGD